MSEPLIQAQLQICGAPCKRRKQDPRQAEKKQKGVSFEVSGGLRLGIQLTTGPKRGV